jgi:chromosome condensin MukBEF ATPase and DNA-binding subunit MukB
VMVWSSWTKEGLSSGNTTGPSSAMAAMATAVVPNGDGLGEHV